MTITKHSFQIIQTSDNPDANTQILSEIKSFLGDHFLTDFLHIRDFSQQLQKPHTIKVELDDSETTKTLKKEFGYEDLGARQISQRLETTSVGGQKIVLIENIERLTNSGANSLLKTLEEPFLGQIIIATTSNISLVLPTIISRGIISTYKQNPSLQRKNREEKIDKLKDTGIIEKLSKKDPSDLYKVFSENEKNSNIIDVLDTLMFFLVEKNQIIQAQHCKQAKQRLLANVNTQSVLYLLARKLCE